jgi:hypothetical protein
MQISNAASSPTSTQTAVSENAASDPASVSANNADPTTPVTSTTSNPSQDSAVTISPEGAAIAANSATDASDAGTAGTAGTLDDPGNTANVSPLKSLAYGTLGLERPDQSQENRNPFYTAGRWIAAGLTIGGIISLLV